MVGSFDIKRKADHLFEIEEFTFIFIFGKGARYSEGIDRRFTQKPYEHTPLSALLAFSCAII